MTRDQLLPLLRRMVEFARTGATEMHPDGARRNPIATYTDPEQFAHDRTFRRMAGLPLVDEPAEIEERA